MPTPKDSDLPKVPAFAEVAKLMVVPELSDKFRTLNKEEQAALLFMANNMLLERGMSQDEIYADPKRLNAMINAVINQPRPGGIIKKHVIDYRNFQAEQGLGEGR